VTRLARRPRWRCAPLQAEQLRGQAPAAIVSVKARQIFDSRGNPTVEAEVRFWWESS
jgi:hypothetical protein